MLEINFSEITRPLVIYAYTCEGPYEVRNAAGDVVATGVVRPVASHDGWEFVTTPAVSLQEGETFHICPE